MKTNRWQTGKLISYKIRRLGAHLKALTPSRRTDRSLPDMRLNDGWSFREYRRSFQEYGDGGYCWWEGCGR